MNPMQRNIPVNPEQVKNAIMLTEAKIGMQQEKLAALTKHSDMTRRLVTYLARYITHSPENVTPGPVNLWITTHQQQEKAERAVIEVQIAELQSQLAIHKFMLEEAEKQGSGLITQ
jgi:hypothetical protein